MSLRPGVRIATNLLRPRASGLPLPPYSRQPTLTPTLTPTLPLLRRGYRDDIPPPPLLLKLKGDLKTAIREKDTARLSVLRTVLAAVMNASKTPFPVTTDTKLVAMLRKQMRAAEDARAEFASAGREDLVAKEGAQIAVLEEYLGNSGVETVAGPALEAIVKDLARALEAETGKMPGMGDIMKTAMGPGGMLENKGVDKAQLVRIIKAVRKGTIDRVPDDVKYG